ncbi:COX15/CtaA family [actinobacterium SCGC AAA044-D11]
MTLPSFIFTALLVFQAGIVVTGGAVRLTGSGLGCPTWPECTSGSIKPVVNQAEGQLHAWIEFGNRLLAWFMLALAIAALIYISKRLRTRGDFKKLRILAILQILGFFGQVVLGGITVLTKLHPISVSAHFVLTLPLIAGAVTLRHRILDRPIVVVKDITRKLIRLITTLAFLVLLLGVVVTGTGPHAGDIDVKRYPFDERTVSWLHADAVIALVSLTIALLFIIKSSESEVAKVALIGPLKFLIVIEIAQGAIGYIQYFTGLPEIIVGAHLVGAVLVLINVWRINLIGREAEKVVI